MQRHLNVDTNVLRQLVIERLSIDRSTEHRLWNESFHDPHSYVDAALRLSGKSSDERRAWFLMQATRIQHNSKPHSELKAVQQVVHPPQRRLSLPLPPAYPPRRSLKRRLPDSVHDNPRKKRRQDNEQKQSSSPPIRRGNESQLFLELKKLTNAIEDVALRFGVREDEDTDSDGKECEENVEGDSQGEPNVLERPIDLDPSDILSSLFDAVHSYSQGLAVTESPVMSQRIASVRKIVSDTICRTASYRDEVNQLQETAKRYQMKAEKFEADAHRTREAIRQLQQELESFETAANLNKRLHREATWKAQETEKQILRFDSILKASEEQVEIVDSFLDSFDKYIDPLKKIVESHPEFESDWHTWTSKQSLGWLCTKLDQELLCEYSLNFRNFIQLTGNVTETGPQMSPLVVKHLMQIKDEDIAQTIWSHYQDLHARFPFDDRVKSRETPGLKKRELKKEDDLSVMNEYECVVCRDGRNSVAAIPCGHKCVCENCAKDLKPECPICQAPVIQFCKIWE